ncbi:hypothetical protein J6590_011486 [Homalodisca vitripennis]|nr:hypothetical protein J6590_011486 [Homalodisca vitripennis]
MRCDEYNEDTGGNDHLNWARERPLPGSASSWTRDTLCLPGSCSRAGSVSALEVGLLPHRYAGLRWNWSRDDNCWKLTSSVHTVWPETASDKSFRRQPEEAQLMSSQLFEWAGSADGVDRKEARARKRISEECLIPDTSLGLRHCGATARAGYLLRARLIVLHRVHLQRYRTDVIYITRPFTLSVQFRSKMP